MTTRSTFAEWLRRARAAADAGDLVRAQAWVETAAHLGWYNDVGAWCSPALDRLVLELSERVALRVPEPHEHAPTLLHVLTQAPVIGGHTALATSWALTDHTHDHSALITRSRTVPHDLARAVEAGGGGVQVLRDLTWRERLTAIREAAARSSAVVLHTHPWDISVHIALLGLARRPPVVAVNHADHVFWTGSTLVDRVLSLRAAGVEGALGWRQVEPGRSGLLPLPLVLGPAGDRTAGRRRLDLADEVPVVLTIGSAYKHEGGGGGGTLVTALALVARHPTAHVIVVGPTPAGTWDPRRTGSRIRAIGPQTNIADLLAAADVYLDSYPFASLTACLQAGAAGLPVVARRPGDVSPTLTSDDPALDGHVVKEPDADATSAALARLLDDPSERRRRGSALAADVRRLHAGDSWVSAMQRELAATTAVAATPGDELLGPDLDVATRRALRRILSPPEYPDDSAYFLWRHRRDLGRGWVADMTAGLGQRWSRSRT